MKSRKGIPVVGELYEEDGKMVFDGKAITKSDQVSEAIIRFTGVATLATVGFNAIYEFLKIHFLVRKEKKEQEEEFNELCDDLIKNNPDIADDINRIRNRKK